MPLAAARLNVPAFTVTRLDGGAAVVWHRTPATVGGTTTEDAMSAVTLYTDALALRRVLSANATGNSFTARTDLLTASLPTPLQADSGGGYIDLGTGRVAGYSPNTVLLKFFGVGSDNTTGNCRVYGVRAMRSATGTVVSYTHVLLAEYAFTLSADVGVASGLVANNERYADTITRTTGIENVADQIVSPGGDVSGHVLVDCKGHSILLVDLRVGSASPATSVNALYAGV